VGALSLHLPRRHRAPLTSSPAHAPVQAALDQPIPCAGGQVAILLLLAGRHVTRTRSTRSASPSPTRSRRSRPTGNCRHRRPRRCRRPATSTSTTAPTALRLSSYRHPPAPAGANGLPVRSCCAAAPSGPPLWLNARSGRPSSSKSAHATPRPTSLRRIRPDPAGNLLEPCLTQAPEELSRLRTSRRRSSRSCRTWPLATVTSRMPSRSASKEDRAETQERHAGRAEPRRVCRRRRSACRGSETGCSARSGSW
jgi:hypothetical protein